MSRTEDKLVQYLIEARAMELALVRTLQAHVAMTPAGDYRDALERHLRETRDHADRIARRLSDLDHSTTVVETAYDVGQRLVEQVLALGKAPLDMLRGTSAEEKLLKNAKDEVASEALEIATYDALERLAELAGDNLTARLAASNRADEERMLETLRRQIPQLTAAVILAEAGGSSSADAARDRGGAGTSAGTGTGTPAA
jgi:ferritin-like metal-binding protein YciE